jgi:hypothetical protein
MGYKVALIFFQLREESRMRRFFTLIGLGFGLALGGGLVYSLVTSETARLFVIGFGMFILGALVVGFFIVLANRSLASAILGRVSHEKTTINYPSLPSDPSGNFSPWVIQPPWGPAAGQRPALPAPPPAWPAFSQGYPQPMTRDMPQPPGLRQEDGDEEYVA